MSTRPWAIGYPRHLAPTEAHNTDIAGGGNDGGDGLGADTPVGGDLTGTVGNAQLIVIGGGGVTASDGNSVPVITYDHKGRVVAITSVPINFPPVPFPSISSVAISDFEGVMTYPEEEVVNVICLTRLTQIRYESLNLVHTYGQLRFVISRDPADNFSFDFSLNGGTPVLGSFDTGKIQFNAHYNALDLGFRTAGVIQADTEVYTLRLRGTATSPYVIAFTGVIDVNQLQIFADPLQVDIWLPITD